MTARDLSMETDGIRPTSFERPRRILPEAARQQCACGTSCHFDCGMWCGGECDTECWNLCVGDELIQSSAMTSPRTAASTTSSVTVAHSLNVCED
jgi:hypothetical protein